jgi:hypothetical protein
MNGASPHLMPLHVFMPPISEFMLAIDALSHFVSMARAGVRESPRVQADRRRAAENGKAGDDRGDERGMVEHGASFAARRRLGKRQGRKA